MARLGWKRLAIGQELRQTFFDALCDAGWLVETEEVIGSVRPDLVATSPTGVVVVATLDTDLRPIHFASVAQASRFGEIAELTYGSDNVRSVVFSTQPSEGQMRLAASAARVFLFSSDVPAAMDSHAMPAWCRDVASAWRQSLQPWTEKIDGYRREVFEIVRAEMAEVLEIDARRLEEFTSLAADLDADSLHLVELSMVVDEAFGIQLSDEEYLSISTVGDVVDRVLTVRAESVLAAEAHRIIAAFDESPTSEKGHAVLAAYDALNRFAAAERGVITAELLTLEGFASAAPSLTRNRVGSEVLRSSVSAIVNLAREGDDRGIRRYDFARWMQALDISLANAHKLFDEIDRSGIGTVRAEEIMKSLGRSPSAPQGRRWGNSVLALA